MCAYQLAAADPSVCLARNAKQQTPIQLAAASEKGEVRRSQGAACGLHCAALHWRTAQVQPGRPGCASRRALFLGRLPQVLNAMLLAAAGHASAEALEAVRGLLAAGAVPDTWAPNGSSALMLAASVDCAEGVALLLGSAASLELQDALGRTALMFAAGNAAAAALTALLDAGASVSIRDRWATAAGPLLRGCLVRLVRVPWQAAGQRQRAQSCARGWPANLPPATRSPLLNGFAGAAAALTTSCSSRATALRGNGGACFVVRLRFAAPAAIPRA